MFKLEFSTDNAAFEATDSSTREGKAIEVSRILGVVRRRVAALHTGGMVKDYNGNTIGKWSLDDSDKGV